MFSSPANRRADTILTVWAASTSGPWTLRCEQGDFSPARIPAGKGVCVVDEDFARGYWPQTSALGHRLFQGSARGPDAEAFTVVGVVGGVKQAGLTDDAAQGAVYYPYIDRPESNIFVAVRGGVRPESLGTALQRAARRQ